MDTTIYPTSPSHNSANCSAQLSSANFLQADHVCNMKAHGGSLGTAPLILNLGAGWKLVVKIMLLPFYAHERTWILKPLYWLHCPAHLHARAHTHTHTHTHRFNDDVSRSDYVASNNIIIKEPWTAKDVQWMSIVEGKVHLLSRYLYRGNAENHQNPQTGQTVSGDEVWTWDLLLNAQVCHPFGHKFGKNALGSQGLCSMECLYLFVQYHSVIIF